MKRAGKTPAWLACMLMAVQSHALASLESSPEALIEGLWLEVRGSFREDDTFLAQRVDLVQPGRYEVLIGKVSDLEAAGHFTILGQRAEVREKTRYGKLKSDSIEGARVKVEGYYRGDEKFSAREISPRGEGRERIIGRIDRIRNKRDGYELAIMKYRVEIPDGLTVRHESPLNVYLTTEPGARTIVDRNRDEEDLFGKGAWLTDNLLLAGQMQARGTREDGYDLRERRPGDRDDLEASFRARMVYQPSSGFFAVAELNHRRLLRDDDRDGRRRDNVTRLGESYLYWIDPFGAGVDFQAGRVDFDDEREWIYDQNLDTVRAIWAGAGVRAELSYSEILSDGSPRDEASGNSMLYVSNGNYDRHLAAYVIHRDFDLPVPERRTHYGVRAYGEWLPAQESWLEVSFLDGRSGAVDNRGWGLDIGSSWRFHDHFALTAGYAAGRGDDPGSATDNTFRQTGLNDNNAKFAGVTSFRYYGELLDPELANLRIATIGIGWLPRRGISLDLVGHSYAQDELSRRLVDTDIDRRPNGRHKDIGTEIDLVFGWRTGRDLDIEAVAAWFRPGKAFDNADDAFLAKLQFRYRF